MYGWVAGLLVVGYPTDIRANISSTGAGVVTGTELGNDLLVVSQ